MTLHTAAPVRANGGTGSVRVSGMQTNTDVTEHPDALEASGTRLKVLECGLVQCRQVGAGRLPQNGLFWGGFGRLSRLAQLIIGDAETQ